MSPASSQLEKWDKQFLWHPFTQHYLWEKEPLLIIDSAKGVYLRDSKGRKYLDGVSSLWVNIHGHRHPVLDRAISRQLKKMAHVTFLGSSHAPGIELGRELAKVSLPGLTRTFYSDNGATAVEVALKMAYQYWIESKGQSRPEFLAVNGSYHGDTIGAVSVGSIGAFHSKFKPLLFKTHFAMKNACVGCPFNKKKVRHRYRTAEKISTVPRPGDARPETGCRWECLRDVESLLKKRKGKISAGILEPVIQGATGMRVAPPGYAAGFSRLMKKHGVLMIADEVATGFGRTGTLFACEQERVYPDFLCMAKGLTGGYSPLAATMTSNKIFASFRAPLREGRTFFHGHSYTGHPLGSAVALANLRLIKSTKLLEKSRRKAHLFRNELRQLSTLPAVGSIRQAGLMAGIDIVGFGPERRTGARICRQLLKKGIWIRPLGDTLVLMPPLVISEPELRRLVSEVKAAIVRECKT